MRKKTLNLTKQPATLEQLRAGVIDVNPADIDTIRRVLTFAECPDAFVLRCRAEKLAIFAEGLCREQGASRVMISGPTYFVPPLERALKGRGLTVVYDFTLLFKNRGFVAAA